MRWPAGASPGSTNSSNAGAGFSRPAKSAVSMGPRVRPGSPPPTPCGWSRPWCRHGTPPLAASTPHCSARSSNSGTPPAVTTPSCAPRSPPGSPSRATRQEILVDVATGWIRLPRGTTLDPGGLGKGLAADIVVEQLIRDGATGALVEIGGDIRAAGTPPIGDAWTIAIAPAIDDRQPRIVQLSEGGVATSTSRLRTWTHQGERRHHLVDPRTLRPADTGAVSCTVVAGSAAWAEAFTKVAFAEHVDTAIEHFESRGLAASITTGDDRQLNSHAWTEFCR